MLIAESSAGQFPKGGCQRMKITIELDHFTVLLLIALLIRLVLPL
jgi:hypothetical protein